MEEQVCQQYCRYYAGKVCQQPARERVARILNIHTAEIYGNDVKGGIG
jgi:hypothetical protein